MANLRAFSFVLIVLLSACAKSREVQKLLPLANRVEKAHLDGTFLYLKSIVDVKSPSEEQKGLAPGQHLDADKLVKFVIRENQIDVVSVDPLYGKEGPAPQSRVMASFPAASVDVVRKRTPDGDETHEEEENQDRRAWDKRDFVRIDLLHDAAEALEKQTRTASFAFPLELDSKKGALNFEVERLLEDGTSITVHYSFLRYVPSQTYVQRLYPLEDQTRFGFFHTVGYKLNAFDQFTESARRFFLNRWDTTKTLVFYYAPEFPEHLKPIVQEAYRQWAQTLKEAVGDSVLEPIRENTGQKLGDLRYNIIAYDDSEHTGHGVLGYAPLVTNPRSGEIVKADVVLYGRVLRRAIFQELFWDKTRRGDDKAAPKEIMSAPGYFAQFRKDAVADLSAHITRLTPEPVKQAFESARTAESAEDLEARIFVGVFTHEFGHALGLRHNFLGSEDTRHISPGDQSTTIMGYGFLQGNQTRIGSYDRAAIVFGYSPDPALRRSYATAGFHFCSDEDVYSSRMPLCQIYDAGPSLTELVERQLDRYLSDYEINNKRLERLDFGVASAAYEKRILSLLLPIRQAYDNAHAVLQAYSNSNWVDLWILARGRIEADSDTLPVQGRTIEIPAGSVVEWGPQGPNSLRQPLFRTLDSSKISAVVQDARDAKPRAVAALRRIILDTAPNRPNYDVRDGVVSDLQVRGVLKDKLLALSLIVSPMDHPTLPGRMVSPYSIAEKLVPALFASLLSNTSEVQDPEGGAEPYYRIRQYDTNLRKHALHLLTEELALVGRQPEARDLIQVQPVKAKDKADSPDYEKFTNARTEFQEFYRTLMIEDVSRAHGTQTDVEFTFAELSPFWESRNQFEVAYTPFDKETLLSAPIALDENGIKTASGLLIRNNLNVAEDYLEAINKTRRQMQDDVFRMGFALSNVVAINELDKRREALRRYITGEQLFLREMYLSYTQEKKPR